MYIATLANIASVEGNKEFLYIRVPSLTFNPQFMSRDAQAALEL
jgi:hypothetical protein